MFADEKSNENARFTSGFVLPEMVDIRKKYTYRTEKKNAENGWPGTKVIVERNNLVTGEKEDVYEYFRNYAMYSTFEPFRQLKDGVWREYALISSKYVRFEVLDLEKAEVIAVESAPTITEEDHAKWRRMGYEKWCEEQPIGTEKPGWGFCPVEFYVPGLMDVYDKEEYEDFNHQYKPYNSEELKYLYGESELARFTGQYALYSGCVWGDDSGGWKLRYIDLSRISEGVVTSDSRYGYVQVASKSLKEIDIWHDADRMVVPVEMYVDIHTGKAFKIDANWRDEDVAWQDES